MNQMLVKTPVYQQLNALLRELIRAGEFQPGAQFLTERQICERFDVSRATANKALSNLVAEGVLEFRKGIGTFVREGLLHYDANALVSFTDKALAAGKVPSTLVLQCVTPALADVPEVVLRALHAHAVETGTPVLYVERVRHADAVPVILERRYIATRLCPGLVRSDLEGSLYAAWVERFGLEIGGADETIRAVNLRGEEAKLLRVRGGEAGFLVISIGYLASGEPLWWEQTWYRGDMYEFRNRHGPVKVAHAATGAFRAKNES
jgi:GntR family transcriptional regulator